MDTFTLNLLFSALTLASSPNIKLGDRVEVTGGHYEGCVGKVAWRSGHEYGIYLVCGDEKRYDFVNKRYLRAE